MNRFISFSRLVPAFAGSAAARNAARAQLSSPRNGASPGRGGPTRIRRCTTAGALLLLGWTGPLFAAAPPAAEPSGAPAVAVAPALPTGGGLLSPENLLGDPARDPAWGELFEKLAPNRTRQSTFEERRYFPFRRAPVLFRGEIRIVPELGLSLRYLEPEPYVMIVDAKGLLVRDAEGRERSAPSDSRAQAATSALVSVLRFDIVALQKDFAVYGQRDASSWTLAFVPRDAAFANLIGTVLVTGEESALRTIELIKSPTQRIEISIRDTREGLIFTGDTLRRFFR